MMYDHSSGVSHCGPQNLTLTSSDQMILLIWEDEPSCSTLHDVLIYELVFLIEDKTVDNVRAYTLTSISINSPSGAAKQAYL